MAGPPRLHFIGLAYFGCYGVILCQWDDVVIGLREHRVIGKRDVKLVPCLGGGILHFTFELEDDTRERPGPFRVVLLGIFVHQNPLEKRVRFGRVVMPKRIRDAEHVENNPPFRMLLLDDTEVDNAIGGEHGNEPGFGWQKR